MKQQLMIQQFENSSMERQNKKEKLLKKRTIRKAKLVNNIPEGVDLFSIDTSKLSREEKAKLQKAKNREAAQRSRDQHKEYVLTLEKEIEKLKELHETSRKLCWKCQREIEETSVPESNSSDQQMEERTKEELKNFSIENEEDILMASNYSNLNQFDVQESFLRQQSEQHDYSYMKMMLFVCMIVVCGMFIGSTNTDNSNTSRALMEISPLPVEQIKIQAIALQKSINSTAQEVNKTAIVPIQREKGLINLKTDDCLNSLMAVEVVRSNPVRSLRSYHENKPTQNYMVGQQGVLLCTVRTPKQYASNYNKLRSPLVRLYLLGSEIKQMITSSNLLIPIRDNNIQINGLYRVAAQIKEVNLVSDHNCIL